MLNHIALQVDNKEQAEKFYGEILNFPKAREFAVPANLSEGIFAKAEDLKVVVFSDGNITFEIFVTAAKPDFSFAHTCLEVKDRQELIKKKGNDVALKQ